LKLDTGEFGSSAAEFSGASAEFEGARPDSTAASENYVVLRAVLPDGKEGIDYRLPDNALSVLPDILRRLPDNRYRVYEIQSDGPERLVRDVFVRQHRVIDQTDASEGMEERPPQSQSTQPGPVAPDASDSTRNSTDSMWEQWESRQAAAVTIVETPDATEGGEKAIPENAQPNAAAPAAIQSASTSAVGATLLAFRLRSSRSGHADDARERFARWSPCPGDRPPRYPTKPR
jgi:hypothetical protein